jgi:hypothetical protein
MASNTCALCQPRPELKPFDDRCRRFSVFLEKQRLENTPEKMIHATITALQHMATVQHFKGGMGRPTERV